MISPLFARSEQSTWSPANNLLSARPALEVISGKVTPALSVQKTILGMESTAPFARRTRSPSMVIPVLVNKGLGGSGTFMEEGHASPVLLTLTKTKFLEIVWNVLRSLHLMSILL